MQRTPEDSLNLLALFANEKYLYANLNPSQREFVAQREVNIDLIKMEIVPDKTIPILYFREKRYHYTVRVSTIQPKANFVIGGDYDCLEEIKWEGPIQDWYKACADLFIKYGTPE